MDLKIEISMIDKYEQYYRCSKNCLCFIRIDLPDRYCKICGELAIKMLSIVVRMIIEFINDKSRN